MTVRTPRPASVTLGALATSPPSPSTSRHPDPLSFNSMVSQFSIPTRQRSHNSVHSHNSHHTHHYHNSHNPHAKEASSHGQGPSNPTFIPMTPTLSNRESVSVDRSRGGERWVVERDRRASASVPPSVPSSASGSKNSSFIGTPRLLSRRGSTRDAQSRPMAMGLTDSEKGKAREDAHSDNGGSPEEEVIETAELRLDRDPGTGRKMINQYLVLHEIGHGTHGRVRLGRDMSVDVPPEELEADLATGNGPFYAIKIVERNPRAKRLAGLGRQRALARSGGDAAKLVAENEIRKEIAIAKKLHHPNVVRMKEIIDNPESSKLFMIFEYCDGGEVEWKAADGSPALTLAQTRQIFRDTLLGLEYLHHQGIIHRDIKPSNLLKSGDKYKISDFGCSHFSEALLASTAGGGEEQYVDDIELAKTAGSPAFFAPEMCYTEIPDDQQTQDVPTFTVRPPSGIEEEPRRPSLGGFTALSDKDSTPRAPQPQRSMSAASIPRKPRLPITNAIDIWALGVTLYCLLFGKTPFDAANEYLLMQEIPTAKYPIPETLSRERLPTDGSNAEANEVLDLLSRLLEKDATKRISVDGAKHHPFMLRGLPDPEAWLASTDPHAQSYVTVTNEEVAAAVTRGGSIREKFRRGFNSISRRLGFGRNHRSHSITDTSEANGENSGTASGAESATRRVASDNGSLPTQSNLARRLSLLSRDRSRAESPRPGLLASHLERNTSPSTPIHSHEDAHLRLASSSNEATPRLMPSASSLDKYRSDSFRSDSPNRLPRRQSSDMTSDLRPRTGSNASSAASVLGALSRNIFVRSESASKRASQRTVNGLRERGYTQSSEETDNAVFAGSFASSTSGAFPRAPSSEFLRGRSFDELGRRQSADMFEPSSPSSHGHGGAFGRMSPERVAWPSSFRGGSDRGGMPGRRGSTLSEDIRPVLEDEEVDWDGGIPDSDDESDDELDGLPMGHGITSAPADWNLSECIEALERREKLRHTPARPAARPLLRPGAGVDFTHLRTGAASPHRVPPPSSFAYANTLSHSNSNMRAKSPLSPHDSGVSLGGLAPSSLGGISTAPHLAPTPHGHGTLTPTTPVSGTVQLPATPEAFADAPEDDDDDGIIIAARGRRGSALSRGNSLARRRPDGSMGPATGPAGLGTPGLGTPGPHHNTVPTHPPSAAAIAQRLASH